MACFFGRGACHQSGVHDRGMPEALTNEKVTKELVEVRIIRLVVKVKGTSVAY